MVFENYYLKILAVDMGIQWVAWGFSAALKTERFYDLTGSATFIALSYLSQQWSKGFNRQTIQSNMVMAWAFRLGSYLFIRILKDGKDKRFDKVRDNPARFFSFWTIQGVWVFVTLLPTLMLNNEKIDKPLGKQDYLGWALWATGMFFEVVADYQKTAFRNDPSNQGKFITTGLWSLSRHPNYFGEITLWFGIYLSCSSTFRGVQYLSVISPLFICFLLTRVSGVPLLEKSGMKRWGELPAYKKYLEDVPVLIPFIKT